MKDLSLPGADVEGAVLDELARALHQDQDAAALSREARLQADLGLSSLLVARVVTSLAARLLPAQRKEVALTDVRTVDDLCRAFGALVAGETAGADREPELVASMRRGRSRRRGWR